MKSTRIFIIPVVFLVSCMSSTRLIQHTDSSYQEVNQKLTGKTVTCVKSNGEELAGDYIGIFTDSITVGTETIAIDQTQELQRKNHGKGVIKGMGWGLLSGFFIGGVIGAVTSGDEETKIAASDETISYMAGAAIGFLLGGVYGGISGVTDYYVFAPTIMKEDESQEVNK